MVFGLSFLESNVTTGILNPIQHKHLSPTGVIPVIESYTKTAWELLEREGSRLEGVSIPLHGFVLSVLCQASACAIFGRSCPAVELYEPFSDLVLESEQKPWVRMFIV